MKTRNILTMIAGIALLGACQPYSDHVIKGTLYSDSTLTTPIAGDTLTFLETDDVYREAEGKYLGQAITDERGRWAFKYTRNLDVPANGAKLQLTEYYLLIHDSSDTLYWEPVGRSNSDEGKIMIYPGCWKAPAWFSGNTSDTSNTSRNAGVTANN